MPKLLFMVMCEHVLLNREDNATSLINLLEGVTIETSEELPEEAEFPQRWGVYAMWRRDDVQDNKGFVQRMVMVSPKGRVTKEIEIPFKFAEGKYNHKVTANVLGLPIGEAGVWSINLFIREDSTESKWSHIGSLPFHVDFRRPQGEKSAAEAS